MGKIVKTSIFAALLIAVGYFFGHVCQQVSRQYNLLFSPSMETLDLAWWLLGALVAVAVMAGMAAVLLRPFWICSLAFALSGLAMLLAYGGGKVGVVLALIYFIAGLIYSWGIAGELNNRLSFSIRAIFENQIILFLALSLVVCASFYVGHAAEIEREGFTVPPGITEMAMKAAEGQLGGIMAGLGPGEKEAFLSQFREQIEQQVEGMIEPFEQFIPLVVSATLFGIVTTIISLLSWIPILFLMVIFPLLKVSRVIREVKETREAKRLII